jgi:hypothetical protein
MWQTSKNGKCIGSFRGPDHLCMCVYDRERERERITVKIITEVPCRDVDWIEPVQDSQTVRSCERDYKYAGSTQSKEFLVEFRNYQRSSTTQSVYLVTNVTTSLHGSESFLRSKYFLASK